MTELPDECGFCRRILEEDEELTPVFLGEPADPEAIRLEDTAERSNSFILGKPAACYAALVNALESSDRVDLTLSEKVREIYAVGEAEAVTFASEAGPDGPARFDSRIDGQTAGARLTIRPERDNPEPDLEVCEHCERSIGGDQT